MDRRRSDDPARRRPRRGAPAGARQRVGQTSGTPRSKRWTVSARWPSGSGWTRRPPHSCGRLSPATWLRSSTAGAGCRPDGRRSLPRATWPTRAGSCCAAAATRRAALPLAPTRAAASWRPRSPGSRATPRPPSRPLTRQPTPCAPPGRPTSPRARHTTRRIGPAAGHARGTNPRSPPSAARPSVSSSVHGSQGPPGEPIGNRGAGDRRRYRQPRRPPGRGRCRSPSARRVGAAAGRGTRRMDGHASSGGGGRDANGQHGGRARDARGARRRAACRDPGATGGARSVAAERASLAGPHEAAREAVEAADRASARRRLPVPRGVPSCSGSRASEAAPAPLLGQLERESQAAAIEASRRDEALAALLRERELALESLPEPEERPRPRRRWKRSRRWTTRRSRGAAARASDAGPDRIGQPIRGGGASRAGRPARRDDDTGRRPARRDRLTEELIATLDQGDRCLSSTPRSAPSASASTSTAGSCSPRPDGLARSPMPAGSRRGRATVVGSGGGSAAGSSRRRRNT